MCFGDALSGKSASSAGNKGLIHAALLAMGCCRPGGQEITTCTKSWTEYDVFKANIDEIVI